MSDLCIYELEDNVWDEFNESDDHIVPHPGVEYGDQFGVQSDTQKKPRYEVINFEDANKYSIQRKEEISLHTLTKKHKMLEKDSWSHTPGPDGVLLTSCDNGSVKEVTRIASEETGMSNHGLKTGNIDSVGSEFCADDPILGEKCVGGNNNTYRYPLSHISQTGNDLGFFDNDPEDKESSDLLYYGWPDDIGNFEDVDRMFRSCDSTFGLGSLSNEDDLCWFSSSHSPEGTEDALKLGSKFPNSEASALNSVPQHLEASRLSNAGPSINDSTKKSLVMGDKISSSSASAVDHSSLDHLTFPNISDTKSVSKDDLLLKEQINWNKKQTRHQNQSEGKRKGRSLENGGSFYHNGIRQHKQNIGSDSLNCMQTHIPYLHMDYSHSSDQISVCPIQSGVKSENNCHLSPSLKESSFASNQLQSMDSSHDPTFEAPAVTKNEKRENICHCQNLRTSLSRNFLTANGASPATFCDSVSVQKQAHQSEYDIEGHGEIGVSIGIPVELDSSNMQETSCMSSALDEISLEATSFRQLQQVMDQLDIRTKLCIRDSLYRLARSAEQRHNCANSNVGKRDDRDTSGGLLAEETNKSTAFMDMETDTNPIDRSIAHLLFHRPSDPSVIPATEASSVKPHPMIHGSITSSPVMTIEQICQEEATTTADKNLLMGAGKH